MADCPPTASFIVPPFLQEVLAALRPIGRPLLVGGCVRDHLLGRPAKDFDIEVYGASPEAVMRALARFGPTDPVGRSFGVLKLRRNGCDYDVSLPRRETKSGAGHRGFAVEVDPALQPAEALRRRDFTINAMAFDAATGALVDPWGGQADLAAGVLRHAGPAFVEDPLRVLRAFQFAARFRLRLAPETADLCRSMVDTYRELPVERVWGEWAKWAAESQVPSAGLRVLEETGWLRHFPALAGLRGVPQEPEWHPEGDVFNHTAHCLDALAGLPAWKGAEPSARRALMLAVLCHDFGKPSTTIQAPKNGVLRWQSPGHEAAGGPLAEAFLEGIGAPAALRAFVRPLVENHHTHYHGTIPPTATAVRRLARRLEPATLTDWLIVLWADHLGRPPLRAAETEARIEAWTQAARMLELERKAPRPMLLGRHLIEAGMTPGPGFKALLDEGFEAQLEGAFWDEDSARVWLRERLRRPERRGGGRSR